jgi:hypothetical protein
VTVAVELTPYENLALRYAGDTIHGALLGAPGPLKASEAARLAGHPSVDLKLARVVLAASQDRFSALERKWTTRSRQGNPKSTMDFNLGRVLGSYGKPIAVDALAYEMSAVYGRSVDHYLEALPKVLSQTQWYFQTADGRYGLAEWLLDTLGATQEDVVYDNFLDECDLDAYAAAAGALDPSDPAGVGQFLDAVGAPVPNKALQYMAWRAKPAKFKPTAFVSGLLAYGRCQWLSDGTWIGPALAQTLVSLFPDLSKREVEEPNEVETAEPAMPLVVTEAEIEQLVAHVLEADGTTRAGQMLDEIFEVSPGDPTYEADRDSIVVALQGDDRVMWVGAERFVPAGAAPAYVISVPDMLAIPESNYLDMEGNPVDLLLETEGLSGGLDKEEMNPAAQDALDEEPVLEPDPTPPVTARCVLKLHHKEIGTLPLCSVPAGFFPATPEIAQVTVVLPNGQRAECWVNNNTRLLYGLLDWYNSLPIDSGAVFYLERQEPDQFILRCGDETEPTMFVSRNRVLELQELGQRAEAEELPTFEILREIMEHYRKGIEFITAHTEVNIARRASRRTVASLLAGYHCFFQRNKAWVYDARKLSQGFDRAKRKYLRKEA